MLKEGATGSDFFILENGEAIATKTLEQGKEPQ